MLLEQGDGAPRINRVVSDSVAEIAGLKAGDLVVRAAGLRLRRPAVIAVIAMAAIAVASSANFLGHAASRYAHQGDRERAGLTGIEAARDTVEPGFTLEKSFLGTDWASPEILIPALCGPALHSENSDTVVIEAVSELRMLAIAAGEYVHPTVCPEDALEFLSQVLAMNLALLFTPPSEAERVRQGRMAQVIRGLFRHIGEKVGW